MCSEALRHDVTGMFGMLVDFWIARLQFGEKRIKENIECLSGFLMVPSEK
jgi:hypothetical protein